jgi:hypothetical protein
MSQWQHTYEAAILDKIEHLEERGAWCCFSAGKVFSLFSITFLIKLNVNILKLLLIYFELYFNQYLSL